MPSVYWSRSAADVMRELESAASGLSASEAERRRETSGLDVTPHRFRARLRVFGHQVQSPLLWLLLFAAAVSMLTGEWRDATIVVVIVAATVVVGYVRESGAERAAEALAARMQTSATVVRDGVFVAVPREAVAPGDVVLLAAGSLVPADAVILEATDCFVSEAVLTGESFPVEKRPGAVPAAATLAERVNCVFLGTNVRSGTARCLVVATGSSTELAHIAAHLVRHRPETAFDRGVRRFGYALTSAMLLLTVVVFVAHVMRGRPPVDTLLFSVALAVGLSPELLPAILSLSLARGAQQMAARGVLVRRLTAIENLGSMDVLCTDKTGTLTEGTIRLDGAYDPNGQASAAVLDAAAINARLQTGLDNPLDAALLDAHTPDLTAVHKLGEIPFDFLRRRLSVIVETPAGVSLIAKGAFDGLTARCTETDDGAPMDAAEIARLRARHDAWSRDGVRVVAVATRSIQRRSAYTHEDETGLTFVGFLTFLDRPKTDAAAAVADLGRLGVAVKIVTGDNRFVAGHLAALVGMHADRLLTGGDLSRLAGAALWRAVEQAEIFAEVDPNQKEQIVLALKRAGHVVGFLGDGVNDAPAMHAADTSVSVERAVDVAREAADFVLLERDLDVLRGGIEEGRRTFANTLKYLLTTMSANLGNMMSMAAASFVLPFLPLLAGQILLNNLLSDVPAVGLADDRVDPELVVRPSTWDIAFIVRFMMMFGVLSSAFDAITFVVLMRVFRVDVPAFRTGWFVESLLTELVIALVVRTRRPWFRSRPGRLLLVSSTVLMAVTLVVPYVPMTAALGFVPLPLGVLAAVVAITALYVEATELVKRWFYRQRVVA